MKLNMKPDAKGRYGDYGGQYVPPLLMPPLQQLAKQFNAMREDPSFINEYNDLLQHYCARPTPLTRAQGLEKITGIPAIFLKREDCLHTGAHKINNAIGQVLLAKKMGKQRIIAETGAGQHGVATATACAKLGLACTVYMGAVDMARQAPNVLRMHLLGAKVVPVEADQATLKEAVSAAMRDWAEDLDNSYYCLGSALGPHPYPEMVAFFQSVIGIEARQQIQQQLGNLPEMVVACIGGGSNAIGSFDAFLQDDCQLVAVEAGGCGNALGEHASRFIDNRDGVLHGCYSAVIQNQDGQIGSTHSISAGLDYPMVGPQHAFLHQSGRVHYARASDAEALRAVQTLAKTEGIIAALESAHAIAYLLDNDITAQSVVVTVSGRGDKDLQTIEESCHATDTE